LYKLEREGGMEGCIQ